MEVILNLQNAEFTKSSNWFIQVEVEQVSYPSKQKSKEKQRTDIFQGSNTKFIKNYFSFKASLSNRIVIKLGAIEVQSYKENTKPDPSKCICQGLYTLVITKRMLAALRDNASLRETFKLSHPTSKQETCSITLLLSLNFSGTEEKIIEDERNFYKVEFDHYEKNDEVITEKLSKLEVILPEKSKELNDWIKKVDYISNALRSLGADAALLKKEKDHLELENRELNRHISRLSSVEDIHIKVDMLSDSPQGIGILKEIYMKTEKRLHNQRMIYSELTNDWAKIDGKKKKLELLKAEVEKVKSAQTQLDFHMLSLKDQLPQALALRENVKNLDSLIQEFEKQIAKSRVVKKDKAVEAEVQSLVHRKFLLQEKSKQVQILLESNAGYLPMEELEKLNLEWFEDDSESKKLQKRGEQLLAEVERLGQELSRETFRPVSSGSQVIELQVKLQAAQARVDAMQERMNQSAAIHAKEVAKYESIIAQLDAKIGSLNDSLY